MGVMSQCCLGICGNEHGISETTLHTFFDVVRTLIWVLSISGSTFAIPHRPLSLPQLQTSFAVATHPRFRRNTLIIGDTHLNVCSLPPLLKCAVIVLNLQLAF